MPDTDAPAAVTTAAGDDPVAAAREWLARNGGVVVEPLQPERSPRSTSGPEVELDQGVDQASGSRRPNNRAAPLDPDADPESVAQAIVLRKLAAQARTRQELAKALAARQVPEDVAQSVLERFEAVGLVDDSAFARDWVQSRQQRRHLSKSALRRELQTKGVDRDDIDAAVAQVDGSDELTAAQALAEKKLRSVTGLPREVQYRRLAGALARRGFSGSITAAVLGPLLRPATSADQQP